MCISIDVCIYGDSLLVFVSTRMICLFMFVVTTIWSMQGLMKGIAIAMLVDTLSPK